MIGEVLRDVVKYTGNLGFIEIIKVVGTENETNIEAVDTSKTILLRAKLHTPVNEFRGEFGMRELGLLRGLAEFPNYRAEGAKVTLNRIERNGDMVPEEIVFTDEEGSYDAYRLMAKEVVPPTGAFAGTTWDVVVSPSKAKVAEFSSRASMYSSLEQYFLVYTDGEGNLRFNIGDPQGASHKGSMIFATQISGEISKESELAFAIKPVLQILKLGDGAESCTTSFTNRGALQISIDSGLAEYRYLVKPVVQ